MRCSVACCIAIATIAGVRICCPLPFSTDKQKHRRRVRPIYACGIWQPSNIVFRRGNQKQLYFFSASTHQQHTANPPHTTPTALGQIRQGQQSTKRFVSLFHDFLCIENDVSELEPPTSETSINNHAYVHVFMLTETMHSDLTGKFPITSFSGMQYIIISVLDG